MGRGTSQRRKKTGNAVSIVILILGALLLLYPVASTLSYQYRTVKQNEAYATDIAALDSGAKAEQLKSAHEYNERLLAAGPHARAPIEGDPGFDDYMGQLTLPEQYRIMARIRVPAINVDLPVYHTTQPKVLYQGAGHMYGSTLPVGGAGTNSVISAHTGMVNAAMFDQLPMLKEGDDIFIEVMGETLRYQMTSREVVKPDRYDAVTYDPNLDQVTLITCTPYGLNTDRLLVHAVRVPLDENQEIPEAGIGWSWWMIAVVVIVLTVFLLIWWKRHRDRKRRREREAWEEQRRVEQEQVTVES